MRDQNAMEVVAPWKSEDGRRWLEELTPWNQAMRLIHGTLQLETKKHPQEIRAAASPDFHSFARHMRALPFDAPRPVLTAAISKPRYATSSGLEAADVADSASLVAGRHRLGLPRRRWLFRFQDTPHRRLGRAHHAACR